MKKSIFVAAMFMASPMAFAAGTDDVPTTSSPGAPASTSPLVNQACPAGVTGNASGSCTNQNQMGDTSVVNNNGETHSTSAQNGNSSAANPSNTTISPEIKPQVTQNTTGTISPTISPTTTSNGGTSNSQGNTTTADNRSSVGNTSTGASTSSNGSNSNGSNSNGSNSNGSNSNGSNSNGSNSNGPMTGTLTGTNTNGNNSMVGGTNTANGGGGGGGGAGGMGGTGGNAEGGKGGYAEGGKSENTMKGESNSGRNTLSNGSSSGASANNGGNTTSSTSASGGNKLGQASKTSNDGSGNSQTNIDSSNRSVYNNKSIFIPPVVPPTPASFVAAGNVIKETSECGPLQAISERDVNGTFHGLFVNSNVHQGYHQELVPYRDENGNEQQYKEVLLPTHDGYRIFGHQVTQYTTVVGVSGARNVAIGGGGSSGSWGQGGMGTSSANQQLVTTIQLRLCDMGTIKYPYTLTVVKEVPVYREVEVKPKMQ